MPPPNNAQLSQREGKIILALQAFNSGQIAYLRRAALAYDVPYLSLYTRYAGTTPRRDCKPNRKKLLKSEETIII